MEHVVMGIYAYYYQVAPMAQEFPEPIRYDMVMGIDDDDLFSTDRQLDWESPMETRGHEEPLPAAEMMWLCSQLN
jgi:hypothetical protein